ncbi:MAG: selenium-dependent xanthine dehydrogenase, partial [Clostridia bacterium]|nr:selenium-dependent xanthine dehydrogenase [Clostridia bacterium]
CTVLLDGKAVNGCLVLAISVDGKEVLTLESLGTGNTLHPLQKYFAKLGASQCGYCTPGMILSAKHLLDKNPSPSIDEIKEGISGNLCRCTGYVKIIDAVIMAAAYFRENKPIPAQRERVIVGDSFPRVDAAEKALGTGVYVDDITLPGMLYARALRSRYPRARVVNIDISAAEKHPDVVRILTAKDVPFNKTGHIVQDWDVMIAEGAVTRYVGDAIALVACRREDRLEEALALIRVDYEELPPVSSPAQALEKDAPLLHEQGNVLFKQRLSRGDVEDAMSRAAYVVSRHYSTPMTDHAFMEPECAVAMPDPDVEGGLLLYTGSQSVYDERREISRMLRLPPEKVRCRSKLVGGGFGGKEDMSVQHHAALMAYHTGKPVKVRFSREESLKVHTKRHAMEIDITTACDREGKLMALRAALVSDCGAYASLGGPVLQRACTHAAGPYHFHNIDITGTCVYTNNVPGGAFRGFGVPQSCFAAEQNLNLLAEMAGISPWEIRYRNAIRPGQELPNGQIAASDTAYAECLEAVKDVFDSHPYAGIAGCMKNAGVGVGLTDIGRCRLVVSGRKVHIRTSAACMGQGVATVCTAIVCTVTGINRSLVVHERPDTALTPDSGTTTASRQTLFTGEATRMAAQKLRAALDAAGRIEALEGRQYDAEYSGETDCMGIDKQNPVSHVAYSFGVQVAVMDREKRVERIVAAYDAGRVVCPKACEGQVEGGVLMGMGYALTENFVMDGGYVSSKYGTLGLLRATDAPSIDVIFVERESEGGLAFGAKGIGEISAIPTAAAIAHAAWRVDGEFRHKLPIEHTAYRK